MRSFLETLLSPDWLMPHGQCYLWQTGLVTLHLISDSLIALAYYSIPLILVILIRQRQDLPFTRIFGLFIAFILACGTTHLMEVWTLWHPAYYLSGVLKAVTAGISIFTAMALIPVVPQVLTLPSPVLLATANRSLQEEIQQRQATELYLQRLNQELERQRRRTESELSRNESRLQLALDNSPIVMFSQDPDLRYTWLYNPKRDIKTDDWIGRSDWEVMPENTHIIQLKQEVLESGQGVRERVTAQINGVTAHYDLILDPIWEEEEVVGLTAVAIDITEQQKLERMKDEFLSVVSHEVRTPLTSLHGSLSLLTTGRLGSLNPKGQRLLEIAARNTGRLSRLVNDILNLERLESGKIEIHPRPYPVAELITQAIDTMQTMALEAGIQLVGCPQDIVVLVDRDCLLQVLTNLLSNAIKFSPRQSQVRVEVRYEWDSHVLFQVVDQGRGIPNDKLDTIFERFAQVDASDTRQIVGTGLGLSICQTIIHQHGGRIWAESKVGQGSVFNFTIPIQQDRPMEEEMDQEKLEPGSDGQLHQS